MKKCDLGYTAGMIDGEGSVSIACSVNGNGKYHYLRTVIQVSSNDLKPLKYLKKIWNLGLITKWKNKNSPNTSYNWRLYGAQAGFLLDKIYKYLIIKKEKAMICLKFQKLRMVKAKRYVNDKTVKKRIKLALKIRKLNYLTSKCKLRRQNVNTTLWR